MRVTFYLIFAACCVLPSFDGQAQEIAVMEVKVTVINGPQIRYNPYFDFELPAGSDTPESILQLSTEKYTAVNFSLPDTVLMVNEAGDSSLVLIDCTITGSSVMGSYTLNVSGLADKYPAAGGPFSGTLTAVITYL